MYIRFPFKPETLVCMLPETFPEILPLTCISGQFVKPFEGYTQKHSLTLITLWIHRNFNLNKLKTCLFSSNTVFRKMLSFFEIFQLIHRFLRFLKKIVSDRNGTWRVTWCVTRPQEIFENDPWAKMKAWNCIFPFLK